MIKYALTCCDCAHDFDAWFSSSDAYDAQAGQSLIECASCGSHHVQKQIMAPAVRTRAATAPSAMSDKLAEFSKKVREDIAENFDYVGGEFAHEVRAMHYGEKAEKAVWGETTAQEAKDLIEEGIPATPLPKPFAPPRPQETKKLN